MFWVGETCSHSEHVFPKLRLRTNFGKRVLSRRNVFPLRTRFSETTQNVCLSRRNVFPLRTRFSKLRTPKISEKRVLSRRNVFWVGETCSHSEHVFPKLELRTPKISEKRVLSRRNVFWVGETCSHSEHVFPKLRTSNSENFGETCSESEKRVPTQNTFLGNSELRTPKISEKRGLNRRNVFWVGETCSHSEHVFPKLRTPNSELRKFRRNVF